MKLGFFEALVSHIEKGVRDSTMGSDLASSLICLQNFNYASKKVSTMIIEHETLV